MTAADWPQIEAIFAAGIAGGEATFETTTPSWEQFDAGKIPDARLVAVADTGAVVGWAAASPVSTRAVYRGVIEHSVYIHPAHHGKGVGRLLLEAFIDAAEEAGYWTIQSSIFPENTTSLRLHERAGFRIVGRRERIARSQLGPHAGIWRDTIVVERRSTRTETSLPHERQQADRPVRLRPQCRSIPDGRRLSASPRR
ncbi:phosphinothricin acetyltransferase [Microbacterium terrae]|nr:phosphinothricin acetyltransferase [Microbacterium terrae]